MQSENEERRTGFLRRLTDCSNRRKNRPLVRVEITDLTKTPRKSSVNGTCAHFSSMDQKQSRKHFLRACGSLLFSKFIQTIQ